MTMKIFLGIPHTGSINTKLAQQLINCALDNEIVIHFEHHRPVDSTRNKIVNEFLKTDCTHLAMIDSDMATFKPINVALKIMARCDKDVISGLAIFPNKFGINHNIFKFDDGRTYVDEDELWDLSREIVEVACVGGGFLLIRRDVVEAVRETYGHLFEFSYSEDGVKVEPEDIYFSRLAKSCGYTIWLHKKVLTHHFRTVDLTQVHMQMNRIGIQKYDLETGKLIKT